MIATLFFMSVILIIYAYFGYPFSLMMLSIISKKDVFKDEIYPSITMIITAFNEEKRIKEKIENTLKLEYPKNKLQVIVASDGSTDDTDQIISQYINQGIKLLRVNERKGKENAQKEALKESKGEIIIFSDVATMIHSDGIKKIISNFADPTVGCVSSEDRLIGRNGQQAGEGIYVKYEMWLRRLESRVNSLVGLSGSFFAARRDVCRDFSADMQSDFRTVLNSVKLGLRGVCDPETVGYYEDLADEKREFDRKVRTVIRGLTVFFRHLEFLNPSVYGLFSYQYFCHKLLRWLIPFFLIIAFLTNAILALYSFGYLVLFEGQVIFYSIAIFVRLTHFKVENTLLKVPVYFSTVNLSILVAWWKYINGQRVVMWAPSER